MSNINLRKKTLVNSTRILFFLPFLAAIGCNSTINECEQDVSGGVYSGIDRDKLVRRIDFMLSLHEDVVSQVGPQAAGDLELELHRTVMQIGGAIDQYNSRAAEYQMEVDNGNNVP